MKYFWETYKHIGVRYARTVFVLLAAVGVLAVLGHHVFSVHDTFRPLRQVNGKILAQQVVARDDSGKVLSEAEPVSARGTDGSIKSIPHVPVAKDMIANRISIPILMYHHVGPLPLEADSVRRDLTVSPQDFALQVQWLAGHGYTTVTLQDVYLATQKKFTLPSKPVVFTFDDGYADVFAFAVPALQKYGMIGSFAIVPSFLGSPDYGSWADVVAAKKAGMEIVSHTENHFDGSSKKFDSTFIQKNLAQSLVELENHVGSIPRILVYPYGHFTSEYIEVAQRVGFTMALTTRFGMHVDPTDLMHTPRVRVHGGEALEKFIEILTGKKK